MVDVSPALWVSAGGFAVGTVFGATARATSFCTMGAISDAILIGDRRRLRSWLLAIAVAVLGTQAMGGAGLIDLQRAVYLSPSLGWPGAVVGGLMFGFGMTLTGGCASRCLVRAATGNLKAAVVLIVMGMAAYATLNGVTALPRVHLIEAANTDLAALGIPAQGLPDLLKAGLGADPAVTGPAAGAAIAGGLLAYCLSDRRFRTSRGPLLGGLVIGLLIPAGWWTTGVLGHDEFDPQPLGSLTFVAPVGDSLQYLMTFTGASLDFGIATVGGVVAGAFLAGLARRRLRIETFTRRGDMAGHLAGALCMGVGGVVALGCTVGQGITGVSTLSAGSFLALGATLLGAVIGVKRLEHGSLRALMASARPSPPGRGA